MQKPAISLPVTALSAVKAQTPVEDALPALPSFPFGDGDCQEPLPLPRKPLPPFGLPPLPFPMGSLYFPFFPAF